MTDLLTQRETAEKLGIIPNRVKQLWDRHELLRVREDGKPMVPAQCLTQEDGQWIPLPAIRGTMIMLLDAGFSVEEATEWMLTEQESLGDVPLNCLAHNRIRDVRNAILPLAF